MHALLTSDPFVKHILGREGWEREWVWMCVCVHFSKYRRKHSNCVNITIMQTVWATWSNNTLKLLSIQYRAWPLVDSAKPWERREATNHECEHTKKWATRFTRKGEHLDLLPSGGEMHFLLAALGFSLSLALHWVATCRQIFSFRGTSFKRRVSGAILWD